MHYLTKKLSLTAQEISFDGNQMTLMATLDSLLFVLHFLREDSFCQFIQLMDFCGEQ